MAKKYQLCVSSHAYFLAAPLVQFLEDVRANALLTRLSMNAAEQKSDALSIDIRYFIYQWTRERGES